MPQLNTSQDQPHHRLAHARQARSFRIKWVCYEIAGMPKEASSAFKGATYLDPFDQMLSSEDWVQM